MSADRVTYLDSSALVKLAVAEAESEALRKYLRRRKPQASSALARVEVVRAVLHGGPPAVARAQTVLERIDLIRVSERILRIAGTLQPLELRSLDALHLATASLLGEGLLRVVTYDDRMKSAAEALGMTVVAPA